MAVDLAGGSRTPPAAASGIAFAWVAGSAVRAQARTAAELVATQAAAARHQIAAERQQLAREFHDLVAHTLSVTMLHMTAVRMSLEDGESGEALEALAEAQRAGREAMREMRQTVTLLGSPPPGRRRRCRTSRPARPGGRVRRGRAKVDLDADGDLTSVSGDAGLAAYRIAQESLTNAAKHAPGSAAASRSVPPRPVAAGDHQRHPPPGAAAGAGLRARARGMSQRATLMGGSLQAGPDGRAWRVEAACRRGDR